jgi:hypothetical protein
VAFLDAGSEVNIISSKLLNNLKENQDFKYIEDIVIRDAAGRKMKTEGRVRIFKKKGIQFTSQTQPVEFEASVREEFANQSWKVLIGTPLMYKIGNLWSSIGSDPMAWFQNKNKEIVNQDGDIPELVSLNIIPECAIPIIAAKNMFIKENGSRNIWVPSKNRKNLFSNSFLSNVVIDVVRNEGKDNLRILNETPNTIRIVDGSVIGYKANQINQDAAEEQKKKPCSLADHPERVHRMVQEQIQRKRNDTKAILLTKLFNLMDKFELEKVVKPHLLNFLIKALQSIETDELHSLRKLLLYMNIKMNKLDSRLSNTDNSMRSKEQNEKEKQALSRKLLGKIVKMVSKHCKNTRKFKCWRSEDQSCSKTVNYI